MRPTACLLTVLLSTPAAAVASSGRSAAPDLAPAAPEHGKGATADASPVEPGVLEVEMAYSPSWNNRGGAAGFDRSEPGEVHVFTGTLTRGLVQDVDVRLSMGFGTIHHAGHLQADGPAPRFGGGLSDAAVGARWRFLSLAPQSLELALTADAVVPVGSPHTSTRVGMTQKYWSARGALVATKDLGRLTANGELAWAVPVSGDAGGLRSTAQANAALGYELWPGLQPELEANYQASVGPGSQVLGVTAGLVVSFGDGYRVAGAVQRGVWGRNAVQTTSAVLAFKSAL
jgi:hypothetical protein